MVCWCQRAWASIVVAWGFPGGCDDKKSASNVGDLSLIPGLGRPPREGNGYLPQDSCLDNSVDRGAWQVIVHGAAKRQTHVGPSVQFSSVAQSCPTPCNPMNRSTPGLPVHHQLPEFTQTHAHRVSDAIQPSHPLLSPSPPAPNPSQHQGLLQ